MADVLQAILNKSRLNKFILVLSIPKVMKDMNTPSSTRSNELVNLDKLQYSVYGIPVPQVAVDSHVVRFYGQSLQVTGASRPPYSPIGVTFVVDNEFGNYWILWKWLAILNKPRTSGMDDYFGEHIDGDLTITEDKTREAVNRIQGAMNKKTPGQTVQYQPIKAVHSFDDYKTIITVYGLDEYNKKIIQFDYYGAFITQLGEISYSNRNPEQVESSFQFVFNQMDVNLVTDE